jgi:uncharacterized membrane protein
MIPTGEHFICNIVLRRAELANNVFANDLEIACKAADGESSVCFPDPCFSPPSPNGGWVLVPYANTAYARDLSNGTTSVFISGLPVAKKDESFLKTSYGNEAAAGPMGKDTGVKQGKAYFKSWSMDVKVEGKNVCRHTDIITHNHGSDPSNTRTNIYKDTKLPAECLKDFKKRDKKCNIEEKENKEFVGDAKQRNKRRAKSKKKKEAFTVRDKTWKDKHCGPVMLAYERKDILEKRLENLNEELDDWQDDLTSALKDKSLDVVGDVVEGKVKATLGCGAIGGAIGGVIGFFFGGIGAAPGAAIGAKAGAGICNAVSIADNVIDAIEFGSGLWQNREKIKEITDKFTEYKEKLEDISKVATEEDPKKRAEQMKELRDEAIEKAKEDPCLKARRCTLTPYENKDKREVKPKVHDKGKAPISDSVFNLNNPSGCCPGQTGHHLIPETTISGSKDKGDLCTGGTYNHSAAPVVCSEGGKDTGTHGQLHDRTDQNVQDMMNGKYPGYEKCASAYTMDCATEAGAQAHAEQFPDSNCDKKCIKAQLKEYYGPLNCKPKPADKSGKPITPTPKKGQSGGAGAE